MRQIELEIVSDSSFVDIVAAGFDAGVRYGEHLAQDMIAVSLGPPQRYAVVASDYQGLGKDGTYHPYLDATTEGQNLIDSVRAARKLVPDASTRWAAFGGSQGGQAAWAANELAGGYAPELQLVGTASYSAPLAIDGFVVTRNS